MIREAELTDVPRLVAMGERFHRYMASPETGPYSPVVAEKTAIELIENELGIFVVAESDDGEVGGMCGGMVFPFYMTGVLTAQEFMWWIDDTHKGQGKALMKMFEAEAKARGAESIIMNAIHGKDHDRIAKIYKRAGYRPSDYSFIKEL